MKKSYAILTIAILSAVTLMSTKGTLAADGDTLAVRAASDNFYAALNAMFTGDAKPMFGVWSHQNDVSYMGPAGGRHVGWDQVAVQWETQAALKLGGEVRAEDTRITVVGDLAVAETFEVGQNFNAIGKPEKVSIRATNVFRKENGEWKMIGHHTDLLPFLQK